MEDDFEDVYYGDRPSPLRFVKFAIWGVYVLTGAMVFACLVMCIVFAFVEGMYQHLLLASFLIGTYVFSMVLYLYHFMGWYEGDIKFKIVIVVYYIGLWVVMMLVFAYTIPYFYPDCPSVPKPCLGIRLEKDGPCFTEAEGVPITTCLNALQCIGLSPLNSSVPICVPCNITVPNVTMSAVSSVAL